MSTIKGDRKFVCGILHLAISAILCARVGDHLPYIEQGSGPPDLPCTETNRPLRQYPGTLEDPDL